MPQVILGGLLVVLGNALCRGDCSGNQNGVYDWLERRP